MTGEQDDAVLQLDRVSKRFGAVVALDAVSLRVRRGGFYALLGPSGCGKTTLMRLVAGFEAPDDGRILIQGVDVTHVPPHLRPVNMMFQSYALFPHMDVAANIGFGLVQQGMAKAAIRERVEAMLSLVQLTGFAQRKPRQLSGGQQQRVALARALARQPRLLLLDEPLAALDRKLREDTQFELKQIQRSVGTTFLVVTHDQDEAMIMADRIAVMREGRVVQEASPREIYDAPADGWVAAFLGDINLLEARVASTRERDGVLMCALQCAAAPDTWLEAVTEGTLASGTAVMLALRPEQIRVGGPPEGAINTLHGLVRDIAYRGDTEVLRVQLASGFMLRVHRSAQRPALLQRDDAVTMHFAPAAARVLTR